MKFLTRSFCVVALFMFVVFPLKADASTTVAKARSGQIMIQVQSHGEAWYIYPKNKKRYYLGTPDDAFHIMRELSLGVTNADLEGIPQPGDAWQAESALYARVRGKVLLQVEDQGQAWYVSPVDGKRHYLGTPHDAFTLMREFGVGITNDDLQKIPTGNETPTHEKDIVLIETPFFSQAPTGDWSSPYNEACEETVLLQLQYHENEKDIDRFTVAQEIQDVVAWEKEHFGFHQDTSAEYTARLAREYFGFDAQVREDVSEETIKEEIRNGNPIIVPVYGKALQNPHFIGGGPEYHVIMIIGFEGEEFITSEPGTRHGEQYRYSVNLLMNAIHDLGVPENTTKDQPARMVVVNL